MKNLLTNLNKPCLECGGATHYEGGGEFSPHIMYNPETGEPVEVTTPEDHAALVEQGFLSEAEVNQMAVGGQHLQNGMESMQKNINSHFKKLSKNRNNMFKDATAPMNQDTDSYGALKLDNFKGYIKQNVEDVMLQEALQSYTDAKGKIDMMGIEAAMGTQPQGGMPQQQMAAFGGGNFGMGNSNFDITPWANTYSQQLQENAFNTGALGSMFGSAAENMAMNKFNPQYKTKTKTKLLFGDDKFIESGDKLDKEGNVKLDRHGMAKTTKSRIDRDWFSPERRQDKKDYRNWKRGQRQETNKARHRNASNQAIFDARVREQVGEGDLSNIDMPTLQTDINELLTNPYDMSNYNWKDQFNLYSKQFGGVPEQYGGGVNPYLEMYHDGGGTPHEHLAGENSPVIYDASEFGTGEDNPWYQGESYRAPTAQELFNTQFKVNPWVGGAYVGGSGNGQWGTEWKAAPVPYPYGNNGGNNIPAGMTYDPNAQAQGDIMPYKWDANGNPTAWRSNSTGDLTDANGVVLKTAAQQLESAGVTAVDDGSKKKKKKKTAAEVVTETKDNVDGNVDGNGENNIETEYEKGTNYEWDGEKMVPVKGGKRGNVEDDVDTDGNNGGNGSNLYVPDQYGFPFDPRAGMNLYRGTMRNMRPRRGAMPIAYNADETALREYDYKTKTGLIGQAMGWGPKKEHTRMRFSHSGDAPWRNNADPTVNNQNNDPANAIEGVESPFAQAAAPFMDQNIPVNLNPGNHQNYVLNENMGGPGTPFGERDLITMDGTGQRNTPASGTTMPAEMMSKKQLRKEGREFKRDERKAEKEAYAAQGSQGNQPSQFDAEGRPLTRKAARLLANVNQQRYGGAQYFPEQYPQAAMYPVQQFGGVPFPEQFPQAAQYPVQQYGGVPFPEQFPQAAAYPQYAMGGTYDLSEDEVAQILASGGQIEYI